MTNEEKRIGSLVGWVVFALILIFVGVQGCTSVPIGKNAVVVNNLTGNIVGVRQPGTFLATPFLNSVVSYPVRTQTISYNKKDGSAITPLASDGLELSMDMTIEYRIDQTKIGQLHTNVGPDYVAQVINPTFRNITRDSVANFKSIEAATSQRGAIQDQMETALSTELGKYGILVDAVRVRDVYLPQSISASIESKLQADQSAQRMEYTLVEERQKREQLLIQADAQAQQKILQAQGEAESIRIVNNALSSAPRYIDYLSIMQLNDNIDLIVTDGNSPLVNMLGAGKITPTQ